MKKTATIAATNAAVVVATKRRGRGTSENNAKRAKQRQCVTITQETLPIEIWMIIIRMALAPTPFRGMLGGHSLDRIQSAVLENTRRAIRLTCTLFAQTEAHIRVRGHVNSLDVASADFDFYRELDFSGAAADRRPPSTALLGKTSAHTIVNMPIQEMKKTRISSFVHKRIKHVSLLATTTLHMQYAGAMLKKCNAQTVESITLNGEAAVGVYGWVEFSSALMLFTHLHRIELFIVNENDHVYDMTWLEKSVPLLETLILRQCDPRSLGLFIDAKWPTTILSTRFSELELELCNVIPSFIFNAPIARHMASLRVRKIKDTCAFEPSGRLSLLTNLHTLELSHLYLGVNIKKLSINSALPNLQRLTLRHVNCHTRKCATYESFFFDGPCKKLTFLFIDQDNGTTTKEGMLPSSFFPAVESLFTTTFRTDCVSPEPHGVHIDKRGLRALRFLDLTGERYMCNWWFDDEIRMLSASIETLIMPILPKDVFIKARRIDLSNLTRLVCFTVFLYEPRCNASHEIVAPPRYMHLELVCENIKSQNSKRTIDTLTALLPRDRHALQTLTATVHTPTACTLSKLEMAKLFRVTLDKEGCTDVKISIL